MTQDNSHNIPCNLVVMASGHVGLKVIEFLTARQEPVGCLVLDEHDPGGYNDRIAGVYHGSGGGEILYSAAPEPDQILARFGSRPPDLGILAWWPQILKGPLLELPQRGWLNFHPSYLPYNRGKHPNFWCLVDETPCGVSLHYINPRIDAGDIVAQQRLEVTWEDTGETVYKRSLEAILALFYSHFDDIKHNRPQPVAQPRDAGSFHYAKELDKASEIHLDNHYTARQLLNIIRARTFPPYPTAYFYDNGRKYAVTVTIKETGAQEDE